jgi:predicted MFS family arabinose efflux permease
LLPLSLLSGRPAQAATITGVLFYFAVNGLHYFAPLYMQGTLGYTAMQSGLAIVPMGLTVIVSARVAGRLMPRTGPRPLLVGGMILIAVGVATWTTIGTGTTYLFGLLPGILTMSVGQGFAFTAMTAASLTGVDPDRHGVAGGLNITAQQVGIGIGVAVLAVIAAGTAGTGPEGVLQGYHAAIAVAAAAGGVAAVVIAAVLRR